MMQFLVSLDYGTFTPTPTYVYTVCGSVVFLYKFNFSFQTFCELLRTSLNSIIHTHSFWRNHEESIYFVERGGGKQGKIFFRFTNPGPSPTLPFCHIHSLPHTSHFTVYTHTYPLTTRFSTLSSPHIYNHYTTFIHIVCWCCVVVCYLFCSSLILITAISSSRLNVPRI